MLNIKIYVGIDGDITRVEKDFDIYAGEFQSKLLSFYVPKSLVTSNYYFTDASDMIVVGSNNHIENYEDTAGDSINLTAVQFARKFISRSGAISFSGTFYAHFNKEVSVGGKEYVLFSRTLPYEMTQNDTSESVDNIMVLNVLNITRSPIYEDESIVGYKNTTYRIATTQEISLPILPSQYLTGEPVDDASEYAGLINELVGDVSQLQDAVSTLDNTKQDKIDDGLETTSNSVVGAINEVNTQAQQNAEDIAEIEEKMVQGFRFIGETTNSYNPETQSSLIEATFDALYVSAGLNPNEKENGDTIIYVYSLANNTDAYYRYIYTSNGWTYYKLPDMELASDNNAGLIKGGTSGVITTHIVAGLINNISVNGVSLSDIASTTASNAEIISEAFTEVNDEYIANKAIADKAGNDISTTYMTVLNGATKDFVKEYAMPANYSNLYFITTGGYADNTPSEVNPQFTNTISNIGTQTIFSLTRTFTEPYRINKNNAIKNEIYVESDKTISVEFTLTTVIKGETASVIRSGTKTLSAGEMENIVLEGNLILLGTDELEVAIGDTMQQVLQVTVQTLTDTATLDLYSNETYPSTFNFSIGSIGGSASPTLSKAILPYDSDFSYSAGASVFDVNTGAIYTSLVDGNVGHLLSDTDYWQETSYVSKTATENVGGVKTFVDGIIAKAFEVRFDSNNKMAIEVASNGVTTLRHYRNGNSYMVQLPTWAGVIACINQIFPTYSSSATYSVGDLVNYNNYFYRCTTAVATPEDFDSNKWTITTLNDELRTTQNNVATLQTNVSNIEDLIPAQASSVNQLADKNFVNSSISTNTAYYIGSFVNVTALNNYAGTVTNNDYAIVTNQELDFVDTTAMNAYDKDLLTNYDYAWVENATKYDLYRFDIETQTWGVRATAINKGDVQLVNAYNRYKYNGSTSEWMWEYTLNTSGFTAVQWEAINSGATATQISKIGSDALTTTAQDLSGAVNELDSDLSKKQDIIQYSTMPVASSSNEGQIVQFTGTTGTYKNGFFYKCVEESGVYSWEEIVFGSTLSPISNNDIDTIMDAILV